MTGKCPKCEKPVGQVYIASIDAKLGLSGRGYQAVSYQCPHCQSVLGVQMDPISLKTDIVREVAKALGRQ